ncbi:MAG: MurR/RpiR family transcriptional regulator [Clostridium butyricum]|nr:MurR/RpiR family transcriptional regulator [Clostridium butyricum]
MINKFDVKEIQSLTSNEEDVLQYIFSNKDKVIKMNINQLAQNTYVSTATILRLCKKLNLKGFNDLKFQIKSDSLTQNSSLSKNIDDSINVESNTIVSNSLEKLKTTISNLNLDDLNYIVDCLCSNKNIHIFGRGLTQMPLEYFYNILLSLNRPCTFYIDPPLLYRDALHMSTNDVLIIGSSGGSTVPIVKSAALSKANSATVVAITSNYESELSKIANIVLHGETQNKNFYGIDVNSRLSIQFIVESILELYVNRLKNETNVN